MLLLPVLGLAQKQIIGTWDMASYRVTFWANHSYEVVEEPLLSYCLRCEGVGYTQCGLCKYSEKHGCRSCKYAGRVECSFCMGTGNIPVQKVESGSWSYSKGILKITRKVTFKATSFGRIPVRIKSKLQKTRTYKITWKENDKVFSFKDEKGHHVLVRYDYLDYYRIMINFDKI